ncbi:hypothetical protein FBY24_3286 [Cellulomonas sp. SLBN-39]|nr:hypothetical protein FBY24_3286 [Cellulomonas sp. SLBN-39]
MSSLKGCTLSGLWRINCKLGVSDAITTASFQFDYRIAQTKHDASIRDYRAQTCGNVFGPCSVKGGIKRATQNSAGPAWAAMTYTAKINKTGTTVQSEIGIRVQDTTVSTY